MTSAFFFLVTLGLLYLYLLFGAVLSVLGVIVINNIRTISTGKLQVVIAASLGFIVPSFIIFVVGYHNTFIMLLVDLVLASLTSYILEPVFSAGSYSGTYWLTCKDTNATDSGPIGSSNGGSGGGKYSSIPVGSSIPADPMYGPRCKKAIEYAWNKLGVDLYKQPSEVSKIRMKSDGRIIIPDLEGQAGNYNPHASSFNNITNQPLAGNIGRALRNQHINGEKDLTVFSPRAIEPNKLSFFFEIYWNTDLLQYMPSLWKMAEVVIILIEKAKKLQRNFVTSSWTLLKWYFTYCLSIKLEQWKKSLCCYLCGTLWHPERVKQQS